MGTQLRGAVEIETIARSSRSIEEVGIGRTAVLADRTASDATLNRGDPGHVGIAAENNGTGAGQ